MKRIQNRVKILTKTFLLTVRFCVLYTSAVSLGHRVLGVCGCNRFWSLIKLTLSSKPALARSNLIVPFRDSNFLDKRKSRVAGGCWFTADFGLFLFYSPTELLYVCVTWEANGPVFVKYRYKTEACSVQFCFQRSSRQLFTENLHWVRTGNEITARQCSLFVQKWLKN